VERQENQIYTNFRWKQTFFRSNWKKAAPLNFYWKFQDFENSIKVKYNTGDVPLAQETGSAGRTTYTAMQPIRFSRVAIRKAIANRR
jgi:hypothetical protein